MEKNGNDSSRRGFLLGILSAAGATSATMILASKSEAKEARVTGTGTKSDPVLYRRTKEVERYYKTLYT